MEQAAGLKNFHTICFVFCLLFHDIIDYFNVVVVFFSERGICLLFNFVFVLMLKRYFHLNFLLHLIISGKNKKKTKKKHFNFIFHVECCHFKEEENIYGGNDFDGQLTNSSSWFPIDFLTN